MNPSYLLKHRIVIFGTILLLFVSCRSDRDEVIVSQARREAEDAVGRMEDESLLQDAISTYIQDNDNIGLAVAYRQLGECYRSENRFRASIEVHQKGFEAAMQAIDTMLMVQNLNCIGTNYRKMAVFDESSRYYFESLALLDQYSDKLGSESVKSRSVALNGIGNAQMMLGNSDAAISTLRLSYDCSEYLQDQRGMAINYIYLGLTYSNRNQIDSARLYFRKAMDINLKSGDSRGIALNHLYFGKLYELENEPDKAITEYQLAADQLESIGTEYDQVTLNLAKASVFIKKGRLVDARECLDAAGRDLQDIESLEYRASLYDLEYQLDDKFGNAAAAFDSYKKSIAYRDSVQNLDIVNRANNIRLDYYNKSQQGQIDVFRRSYELQKREKRHLSRIATIFVFCLFGTLAFLMWSLSKRKKKHEITEKMDNMRTNFFTNVTHEFRTPLTVILGLAEELENKEVASDPNQVYKMSETIARQGRGLLNLVNQLLDISKIKSALGKIEWRYGDMINFLRTTVEPYVMLSKQKGIEMIFFPSEEQLEMDFVPDYVRKIVVNLLSNSIKYTQEGGHIYVSSSKQNNIFSIKVSDTGNGISDETLKHIFEPFFVAGDKSSELSTGVGLSLTKQLVEAMSGTIEVQSELGRGATFTVSIPIHRNYKGMTVDDDSVADTVKPVTAVDLKAENPFCAGQGVLSDPLVMIVEDNRDVAYYIGTLLSREHRLCYAENGLEAFESAIELVPDLIITDLMMPEMDGLSLVREIRSSRVLSQIPVIVITAKVVEEEKLRLIEAGADVILPKPLDGTELCAHVQNLLKQRSSLREIYSSSIVAAGGSATVNSSDGTEMSKSDKAFLSKFVDYVLSSLSQDKPADISAIASHMCVSPRQLSRKINALTGESTSSYVNRIKLNKAKQMLDADNSTPIADVAMSCGFEDISYFGKLFRQYEGISPSQYRRRVN